MSFIDVARVGVENVAYSFDKAYDYAIPSELAHRVKVGSRVTVPFGSGNKTRLGVVFETGRAEYNKKIKAITAVPDEAPLLNDEMIKLALWLKENTFCTLFEAAKCLLPSGVNLRLVSSYIVNDGISEQDIEALDDTQKSIIAFLREKNRYVEKSSILKQLALSSDCDAVEKLASKGLIIANVDAVQRVNDASVRMARIALPPDELENITAQLTKKQKEVVNLLLDVGAASSKEICYFLGVTSAVVSALVKKGVLELFDSEYYRTPCDNIKKKSFEPIVLTAEQENAFEKVFARYKNGGGTSLLYGVTGSGKTQVYLKLIDRMRQEKKGVIVMVPEISLTAQTLNIFKSRYGDSVAVFHSALSLGERMDEWKRVRDGKADIVVGTRSAVFAPLENIGAIIVDEEHEHTYKSESTPRYNAKSVARFRCAYNKAVLLLASATPSVESYSLAKAGRYSLVSLENRYGNAVLPEVLTVDMTAETQCGVQGNISRLLYKHLRENLDSGMQSILLMNRRGYNTFVSCKSCGSVVTCPNCSISMTYHSANNRLMCHYCGYSEPFTDTCKECGEHNVRYAGAGTQHIEQELAELFPNARILRMDADTTMAKYSHETKLAAFANGEYDIMLGTQMVAKGLDFPNVTLVGIINADSQLYNEDFRSLEQTFSLLTQVVGRAGRGKNQGRAVIQTATPENPIIKLAAKQDYKAFFDMEIQLRKAMVYPPYCDLCLVGFVGTNEMLVKTASRFFFESLKNLTQTDEYKGEKLIVLGPMAPRVSKISNKYRYRLIIKCKNTPHFRKMVSDLLMEYSKNTKLKSVTAYVDMNPENV